MKSRKKGGEEVGNEEAEAAIRVTDDGGLGKGDDAAEVGRSGCIGGM